MRNSVLMVRDRLGSRGKRLAVYSLAVIGVADVVLDNAIGAESLPADGQRPRCAELTLEEVDRTGLNGWRGEITYRLPMQGLRETSYDLFLAGGDPHTGPGHIARLRYRESDIKVVKTWDPSVELRAGTQSDNSSLELTLRAWPRGVRKFLTLRSTDGKTCARALFVPSPIASEHAGCRVELLVGYIVHDSYLELRGTGFRPKETVRLELRDGGESTTWTSEASAQGALSGPWLPMDGLPGDHKKRVLKVEAEACAVNLEGW